jgi:hypothetical protein
LLRGKQILEYDVRDNIKNMLDKSSNSDKKEDALIFKRDHTWIGKGEKSNEKAATGAFEQT